MFEINDQTLTSFVTVDDVVFVAHLVPDDAVLYDRFKFLAQKYRDRFSFAVSGPVQRQSALRCYNNVDDEQHMSAELASVDAMEDFIKMRSAPLIPEITRRNEAEYSQVSWNPK